MNHFVANYRSARLVSLGILAVGTVALQPAELQAQPVATPAATSPVIARGGPMPLPSVRSAATLTPAQTTMVTKWVTTEIAAMTAGDPVVLASARGNLVTASFVLAGNTPAPASPAYQAVYAEALDAALLKQLGSGDVRVRLNAAVTLEKVASKMTQGTALAKSTEKAISDSSVAVAMWGVRASKGVYPYLLDINKPGAAAMADKIVKAVRKFPASPQIAEGAFEALSGSAITGSVPRASSGVDAIIELLQARAHCYMKTTPGVLPEDDPFFPARPDLDAPAMTYVAITGWKGMTAPQKAKAGRAIFDQATEMVRVGTVLPPAEPGITAPRLNDMMRELNKVSGALQVICGHPPVAAAGVAAAKKLGTLATPTPAAPLMQTELTTLSGAMTTAGILAAPIPPPAANAPVNVVAPAPAVAPANKTPANKSPVAPAALNK